MKSLIHKISFLLLLIPVISKAQSDNQINFDLNNTTTLNYLIDHQLKEKYPFAGLAFYLNQVQYYIVDKQNIYSLDRNSKEAMTLDKDQWFAVAGRFNVLLIKSNAAAIRFGNNNQPSISSTDTNSQSYIISKANLKKFSAELNKIRYHHLSVPFAIVTRAAEWLLVNIQKVFSLSWGLSILLFALVIKLLLLPVSLLTTKSQGKVSAITAQLQPKLQKIKQNYDGEEAHNKLMQAYKDVGVSPFYTMKPMLSFLIQIPVLIAVFNALAEMPQLSQQSFLWFSDLSQPDMWLSLNFELPFMSQYLNLMPILMTIITLTSTVFHTDVHASKSELKKQRIKLYLMSAAFLVLFYPFPAAMVMYWAMANLLQFIQTKL